MDAMDPEVVKRKLEEEGFEHVSVEPSAIQGSPHPYVYAYLTPREHEGPHIIVSEMSEYEDSEALLVGLHPCWEESCDNLLQVRSIDAAVTVAVAIRDTYYAGLNSGAARTTDAAFNRKARLVADGCACNCLCRYASKGELNR